MNMCTIHGFICRMNLYVALKWFISHNNGGGATLESDSAEWESEREYSLEIEIKKI